MIALSLRTLLRTTYEIIHKPNTSAKSRRRKRMTEDHFLWRCLLDPFHFGLFSIDFSERTRRRRPVFVQKQKGNGERSLIRRRKNRPNTQLLLFFIRFSTRTLKVQWLISPLDGAEARIWCQKKISGTADSSWRPYNTVLGRCV